MRTECIKNTWLNFISKIGGEFCSMQRTSLKEDLNFNIHFQPKQQEALELSYKTPVTFYGGAKLPSRVSGRH